MKLASFRVKKYRNILDSTEVEVQQDVTSLVGMNESGKSAMLDALYRLNPVYEDGFRERDDYPRWRWKRDGRQENLDEATPIQAEFILEDADKDAVAQKLGADAVADTVRVWRTYGGQIRYFVSVDEAALVKGVLEGHPEARSLEKQHQDLAGLHAAVSERQQSVETDTDEEEQSPDDLVLQVITSRFGEKVNPKAAAWSVIGKRLPKFFKFSAYQNLPGRVDVSALRQNENEAPGASSKQTVRALLKLAETDVDSLSDKEFESRTAELEAASSELSREMNEYWSTNPDLRIKVDVESETKSSSNGGKQSVVTYLNFRVEDRKHDFTNNFSQRSSGYQWFFSFLAAFSEFEYLEQDVIVLLDEPALTLHAKAQRDFLRFINERLAPVGQVLYTTHSPFMVQEIERVRIVEDRGGDTGSVTSSDALEVGDDSVFPLQAALGYDLSQNLFVGERNLLVEGPSDLVYLDLISRCLREQGREGLDESWEILPAGGASNVPTFISLLGRKVDVTVLLDSGTEGGGKVAAAVHANRLDSKRVVLVSDVIQQKHSDIEDLFSAGDYLKLYNEAFGTKHKVNDLQRHPDRVLKRVEALNSGNSFDHWKPAEVLLRQPAKLRGLSTRTLDNFEALAKRINATKS